MNDELLEAIADRLRNLTVSDVRAGLIEPLMTCAMVLVLASDDRPAAAAIFLPTSNR